MVKIFKCPLSVYILTPCSASGIHYNVKYAAFFLGTHTHRFVFNKHHLTVPINTFPLTVILIFMSMILPDSPSLHKNQPELKISVNWGSKGGLSGSMMSYSAFSFCITTNRRLRWTLQLDQRLEGLLDTWIFSSIKSFCLLYFNTMCLM